jgi:hypothetical protein
MKSSCSWVFHKLLQRLQCVTVEDREVSYIFCCGLLSEFEDYYKLFTVKIVFSDEVTFYVSGLVNRHNVSIWRSNNPHVVVQGCIGERFSIFVLYPNKSVRVFMLCRKYGDLCFAPRHGGGISQAVFGRIASRPNVTLL